MANNVFASVVVPSSSPAVGASTDVSTLGVKKSVVLESAEDRTAVISLEGTHDGVNYAPLRTLNLTQDPNEVPVRFTVSAIRARRLTGSGAIRLSVGGVQTANSFASFDVPTSNSPGTALDTSLHGGEKTFNVVGRYSDIIIIQGSNDGVNYDPVTTFSTGSSDSRVLTGCTYSFMRVVRTGAIISGLPAVTVGSSPVLSPSIAVNQYSAGLSSEYPRVYMVASLGEACATKAQQGSVSYLANPSDRLFALPFWVCERKKRLVSMSNYVRSNTDGNAPKKMRWGIYTNIGLTLFPGRRLYDVEVTLSTNGLYEVTPNIELVPGIYWYIYLLNTGFNTGGLKILDLLAGIRILQIMGMPQSNYLGGFDGAQLVAWSHAYPYDVLPSTFPTTAPLCERPTLSYLGAYMGWQSV